MDKLLNNNAFKTVAGGVVVYLFCELLVRPVVGIVGNYSGNLWGALVNYYYQSCANADIKEPLITIIAVVFCAIYGMPIVNGFFEFSSILKTKKEIKEIEAEIKSESNETKLQSIHESSEVNEAPVTMHSLQLRLQKIKKNLMKKALLNALIILLNFIVLLNLIFFQITAIIHKSSFDQYLILITPYTEVSQINLLKSDWIRMESKSDYDKIDKVISDIVEKNSLK